MTRRQLAHHCALPLLMLVLQDSRAACDLTPTAGDDHFVCDSGTAPGVVDTQGNNSLGMPYPGTGTITGNVVFGNGNDSATIASGTLEGNLDLGSGNNRFNMSGGIIRGTLTGSAQATMSGGSIGQVDLINDNNRFQLQGGAILGNLVSAGANDVVMVTGGTIGSVTQSADIITSGGNNQVLMSDGTVYGEIHTSSGDDFFNWRDAGIIHGAILMGAGSDRALIQNLPEAALSSTPSLDGGLGNDSLVFENSSPGSGGRYVHWESVALTDHSAMILNDSLVLGDSGTGSGHLDIDASSSLSSSTGLIRAFDSNQNATLNNSGTIYLTAGGAQASDRLTVIGNYVGNGGSLKLQSVLAGDDSPSDRLVVSRGSLSGSTTINVANLGGNGAETLQNGIQVVEANQGATSSDGAFHLGGTVSAGAFDYFLYKGGVTPGTQNNWYLRSSVTGPVVPLPEPEGPVTPLPGPEGPLLPDPEPGETIPFYRPEVAVDALAGPAAALLDQAVLGNFHQRQGDQALLRNNDQSNAGWLRTFASDVRQGWSGDVAPGLEGHFWGLQAGHDLYATSDDRGNRYTTGLFVSHARLQGSARGFVDGFQNTRAGTLRLNSDSLGIYWNLIAPNDAYLDAVAMGSRYHGSARSDRQLKFDIAGHGLTLSLEGGYPYPLTTGWVLEPQAQFIVQKVLLDNDNDGISQIRPDSQDYFKGRLGVRAKGSIQTGGVPLEPYVRANLWHTFGGSDTLSFDGYPIRTEHGASNLELGGGILARLSRDLSVYGGVDYTSHIDSHQQESLSANLGVRLDW